MVGLFCLADDDFAGEDLLQDKFGLLIEFPIVKIIVIEGSYNGFLIILTALIMAFTALACIFNQAVVLGIHIQTHQDLESHIFIGLQAVYQLTYS